MTSKSEAHPFSRYQLPKSGEVTLEPFVSRIALDTLDLFELLIGFDPTSVVRMVSFYLSETDTTIGGYMPSEDNVHMRVFARSFSTFSNRAPDQFVPQLADLLKKKPEDLSQDDKNLLGKYHDFFDAMNSNANRVEKFGFILTLLHEVLHGVFDHEVMERVRNLMGVEQDFYKKIQEEVTQLITQDASMQREVEAFLTRTNDLMMTNDRFSEYQRINSEWVAFLISKIKLTKTEQSYFLLHCYVTGLHELGNRLAEQVIHHWLKGLGSDSVLSQLYKTRSAKAQELKGYTISVDTLLPDHQLLERSQKIEDHYDYKNTVAVMQLLKDQIGPLFSRNGFVSYMKENFVHLCPDAVALAELIPWDSVTENSQQYFESLHQLLLPFEQERTLLGHVYENTYKMLSSLDSVHGSKAEFTHMSTQRFEARKTPKTYQQLVRSNEVVVRANVKRTDKHLKKYQNGVGLTCEELNNYLFSCYVNGLEDLLWHAVAKMESLRKDAQLSYSHTSYFEVNGEFMSSSDVMSKHWSKLYLAPSVDLAEKLKNASTIEEIRTFITNELLPSFGKTSAYRSRVKDLTADPEVFKAQTDFMKRYKKIFTHFQKSILATLKKHF